MRLRLMLWLCIFCAMLCLAGENLVYNGDFSKSLNKRPIGWVFDPNAELFASGGPQNKAFIRLKPCGNAIYENKVRQYNLTMVAGEQYRLSAWIRTKDFQSPQNSIVLTNEGWFAEAGLRNFPKNTDWIRLETTFVCPESKTNNSYGFVCLAVGHKGLLDIADIQMEPVIPEVAKFSAPTAVSRSLDKPRLVPFSATLNAIPLDDPRIPFRWFGVSENGLKAEDCVLNVTEDVSGFAASASPLPNGGQFEISLKGLPEGWHRLLCRVSGKADGTTVYEMPLWIRLRQMPKAHELTPARRLNNFSCDYFNGPVAAGQQVDVVIGRDSWFFLALNGGTHPVQVTLDGQTVIFATASRPEAFRYLEPGRHRIISTTAGTLVVRSIAETLGSAMLEGPRMTTFPKYDWDFTKKWASNAITSYNRGHVTPEILKECHEMGCIWTLNLNATKLVSTDDALNRLKKVFHGLAVDGITADEFAYTQDFLMNWSPALKVFDSYRDKRIYTWCSLRPLITSIHTEFISACLNASMGRGKILSEVYMKSYKTQRDAEFSIQEQLIEPFKDTRNFFPGMAPRTGIVLGNFNQIGVITLEHQPQVDYKYFLDMQMHTLATHPVFEGLGTTGYWGYHYCDEEMYRWSSRLLRHYVIEGRRDMLSETYGFSYLPGHIRNNDFEDGANGLESWTVKAAAPGAVAQGTNARYSDDVQNRWYNADQGGTFCVFTKTADGASTISQTATGLVPGKQYMLLFCTADLDDVLAKRLNPRKLGLDAALDNVTIDENMVWIDNREFGNYAHNHHVARMNVNRIIFRPKAAQVNLSFSNAKAKDGEKLILNYIQLKPFYPVEQ